MYGLYLVFFLTTVLFEEVICGVSISFCAPTIIDLFPFPEDCTRYISCNQGQSTVFSCTHGSTFNSELNRCDYEQRIDNCQNSIGNLKDLQIFCPKGSINSFSHPFDCEKYIACSYGLAYTMNCSSGTVYNSLKSICDWRYNVPGCYGNLGNGVTLRGDVTLSLINLDIGSMNFENKKYAGNENQTNQLIENENKLPNNQNYQTNKPPSDNNPHYLQPVDHNNYFTNKPTYHEPEKQPNYSTQNGYANGNQQYNHQTNFASPTYPNRPTYYSPEKPPNSPLNYQTTSNIDVQPPQCENYGVNKPSSCHPSINHGHPTLNPQSSNQPIIFPTEKPTNDEDEVLDIDIRMRGNELDDRISKITRNGRADTALSFDQVLAINNLAESKKMSNNTRNEIENIQKQNVSESHELYNSYPSANKLNNDEDHVESSSELHARIINSPNNWFNSKPLEPVNNYIDESHVTEQIDDSKLIIFKDEIESVPSTTSETPSTKIIVENSPSINLFNYNYIEDYGHDSVHIDQNYSKIRNHTVSFIVNNNDVRTGRTIQKLNHKYTRLKKIGISLSTSFVTPFKSEGDNKHVEFSGQILRLKGGSSAHHGYVEIRGIGFVGQCDDSWNLNKAHKICNKLGYKRGAKITWKGQSHYAELPLLSLKSDIFCQDDKSEFQTCTFTNTSECSTEHDTIGVECFLDSPAYCSENEVPFHNNCYHLVNSSLELNHEDSIQYCFSRNSSLLYITAQGENDFISEWLTQKYPQVESVMTAGIGFTTIARTIWVWQDSAKSFFNFMKWWPGWKNEKILPPSAKSSASCIVMKNKFPCYDQPSLNCKTDGYFFWDIEDCTSSMKGNHYICKRPYNNIML